MGSANDCTAAPGRVRVILIDDDLYVRSSLSAILGRSSELSMVAAYERGEDAVGGLPIDRPHVALVDILMPGWDGPQTANAIRQAAPDVRIVALTSLADERSAAHMLRAGAMGFLAKDLPIPSMIAAIRSAATGVAVLTDPAVRLLSIDSVSERPDLTEREVQILRLVMEGKSNTEIGLAIFLSPFTVKHHISTIASKLGATNRTDLAVKAVRLGF